MGSRTSTSDGHRWAVNMCTLLHPLLNDKYLPDMTLFFCVGKAELSPKNHSQRQERTLWCPCFIASKEGNKQSNIWAMISGGVCNLNFMALDSRYQDCCQRQTATGLVATVHFNTSSANLSPTAPIPRLLISRRHLNMMDNCVLLINV